MADTDETAGVPSGVPVCQSCGRPTDDLEAMGQAELLDVIHLGVLKDLARALRGGDASHQELAIARGILRDNKIVVPLADGDKDDELPEPGKTPLPARRFPDYGHNE